MVVVVVSFAPFDCHYLPTISTHFVQLAHKVVIISVISSNILNIMIPLVFLFISRNLGNICRLTKGREADFNALGKISTSHFLSLAWPLKIAVDVNIDSFPAENEVHSIFG